MFRVDHYYRIEDGWNIPDETIKAVFSVMSRQGKSGTVFLDGGISTPGGFLEAMQSGNNWLFLVSEQGSGDMIGVLWLNRREGRMVRVHFCTFDGFTLSDKITAAKEATDYVLNIKDDEGYLFDCLVGYIPEFNKAASMFVRGAGFRQAGVIPSCLLNASTDNSEPASILYKTRNEIQ